jgi:uncharacterized protein (DUF4415 family)
MFIAHVTNALTTHGVPYAIVGGHAVALHGARTQSRKSKLISLKIPEDLLDVFKQQCELNGVKYQTQIKQLMRDYLLESV